MTQYVLWMLICFLITLVVVLAASKRLTIIPTNKFTNMVEYGYEFVKKDMGESAIGHGYKKHLPFLATLFFFILISNFVGLIPGCKTPTGSISITWALAAISFIYFIFWGIKAKGLGGYLKSFAPSGLPLVMVPIVWFLELFSTVLRVLTLAVRLYGNMFAGHMVLGIFALLTSVFIGSAIQGAGVGVGSISIAWMLFLFAMYALEVRLRSCRPTCSPSSARCTSAWPRPTTRSTPRPFRKGRAHAPARDNVWCLTGYSTAG